MNVTFSITGRRESSPPTQHNETLSHAMGNFVIDLFAAQYEIRSNHVSVGREVVTGPARFKISLQCVRSAYPTVNTEKPEQMFRVFKDAITAANWIIETSSVGIS